MTPSIAFDAGRHGSTRRVQAALGIVLLEALIAVLVLSLGTLGIAGLAARALRDAGDAHWRGEAAGLATSTLARMWTEDPSTLASRYDSSAGGAGFREIVAAASRLPGVSSTRNVPVVAVREDAFGTSPRVTITLFWQGPGDVVAHRYAIEQVVASR
jgi:type IV pilus assembly protein PilV